MAKSPEEMKAAMIAGLRDKTGKSLDEWLQILRSRNLAKHKEFMNVLKTEYGLTHGFANMIALQALNSDSHTAIDPDALVDAQYAGAKAEVRPIYEAILAAVKKFGKDVEISPKKAYVSLRRSKQFAIVQPSTSARVDVGIILQRGQNAFSLLRSHGENSDVGARKSPAMESTVRVHTACEFGVREIRPGLDQNPARHKPPLLCRGAEAKNEDQQQHCSQEKPARPRRIRVRRARTAVEWGRLPFCTHDAGLSPSFTKLAMCQNLKDCQGDLQFRGVQKLEIEGQKRARGEQ